MELGSKLGTDSRLRWSRLARSLMTEPGLVPSTSRVAPALNPPTASLGLWLGPQVIPGPGWD